MSIGFKPESAFVRNNSSAKTFSPKPSDHMIEILAYDLPKAQIIGRNHMGAIAAYYISSSAISRMRDGDGKKFVGHRIDKVMEKDLKVGRRVVLEAASWKQNNYTVPGFEEKVKLYEANKVINSTVQGPTKLFGGLFSAIAFKDRITAAQHWQDNGIDLGSEKYISFLAEVDIRANLIESGVQAPMFGFQLRALKQTADGYAVFDSTKPYDHKQGDGEIKYLPFKSTDIQSMVDAYVEYVAVAYPGQQVKVDMITYTGYKASIQSADMDSGKKFPLNWLTNKSSKICASDNPDDIYQGKNTGVRGFIELTADKKVETGKIDDDGEPTYTREKRDMVQKLHANNWQGDIRAMVLTEDGSKVVLDECLKVQFVNASTKTPVGIALQHLKTETGYAGNKVEAFDDMEMDSDPFGG